LKENIKEYWEERAQEHSGALQATTNDIYLRKLEVATIIEALRDLAIIENGTVLDVGCGDGYTTLEVAEAFPMLRFQGLDYSENMISTARRNLESRPGMKGRAAFDVADVTDLDAACGNLTYDVIISDRCLINLDSVENQARAIAQIAHHTKSQGYYLAVENFIEGHENMNSMRRAVGLPEIPVRWHNLYFKQDEFVDNAQPFFDEITFKDFSSSYYFATRIIYSAMCQLRGEQPDYHHDIHKIACRLPWTGQFSPIRLAVLRRNAK
jgi:ubiquinone/menaquinone biosynthesis C-methylase UbiE